jgi:lysine/ornithine N-monooxygenase
LANGFSSIGKLQEELSKEDDDDLTVVKDYTIQRIARTYSKVFSENSIEPKQFIGDEYEKI